MVGVVSIVGGGVSSCDESLVGDGRFVVDGIIEGRGISSISSNDGSLGGDLRLVENEGRVGRGVSSWEDSLRGDRLLVVDGSGGRSREELLDEGGEGRWGIVYRSVDWKGKEVFSGGGVRAPIISGESAWPLGGET